MAEILPAVPLPTVRLTHSHPTVSVEWGLTVPIAGCAAWAFPSSARPMWVVPKKAGMFVDNQERSRD